MKRLAIVVPCYNEEEVFENTAERLTELLSALVQKSKISPDSYILFVDDGSTDNTWRMMMAEYEKNFRVQALGLAGNAGQQNALMAGFACVVNDCDMAVSIDADLQDDLGVLEEMIDKCHQGTDVVYGVRNDRRSDTFFKRTSAHMFYSLMKMLGTKTVSDHAEYRLMSAEVLRELMRYDERNIFLRGIIPLMGFRSEVVYYARKRRTAGRSKYSPGKMFSTALEAITSFSIRPLSMMMLIGAAIALCAFVALSGFMALSLSVNWLNYWWHGAHIPNNLPYRFAFLLVFTMLIMAGFVMEHLDSVRAVTVDFVLLGVLAAAAVSFFARNRTNTVMLIGTLVLAVGYTLLLVLRAMSQERRHLYGYINCPEASEIHISVGDRQYTISYKDAYVTDFGWWEPGEEFTVAVAATEKIDGRIYTALLDETALESGISRMAQSPARFTEYTETRISCHIEAKKGKMLFTSIPYEKGWRASVNGTPTDILPIGGGLIGIPFYT